MRFARSEVGLPLRILELGRESFELAATDVLESLSMGRRRRVFVEEDRDVVRFRDGFANLAGEGHAVRDGGAFEGNEGDDIDRAHPRVLSAMGSQVDHGKAGADQREHRARQRVGVAREGENGSVVGRVRLKIQDPRAALPADSRDDRLHDLGPRALREVGNTLDQHERDTLQVVREPRELSFQPSP